MFVHFLHLARFVSLYLHFWFYSVDLYIFRDHFRKLRVPKNKLQTIFLLSLLLLQEATTDATRTSYGVECSTPSYTVLIHLSPFLKPFDHFFNPIRTGRCTLCLSCPVFAYNRANTRTCWKNLPFSQLWVWKRAARFLPPWNYLD